MYVCRRTKLCVPCKEQFFRRWFGTRRCLHSRLAYSHHRDHKWNKWVNAHSLFCGLCINRCSWYGYFSGATRQSTFFPRWLNYPSADGCVRMARASPFSQPSSIHRAVTTWCLRFRHFVGVKCFTQSSQCISICFSTFFRDMLYNVLSVIRRRMLVLRGCYTWWECEWSSLPEEFQYERRMRIHWPACFV